MISWLTFSFSYPQEILLHPNGEDTWQALSENAKSDTELYVAEDS